MPKLTLEQAQKKAHDFRGDERDAKVFAATLNEVMEIGPLGPFVPVNFGELGWGVMLQGSYEMIREMNVVP
jgi:hypothetical protein